MDVGAAKRVRFENKKSNGVRFRICFFKKLKIKKSQLNPLDLELPSFPNWRSHERNAAPAPHPTGDSPLRCTPAPKAAKGLV
jgi:hypothetical protein